MGAGVSLLAGVSVTAGISVVAGVPVIVGVSVGGGVAAGDGVVGLAGVAVADPSTSTASSVHATGLKCTEEQTLLGTLLRNEAPRSQSFGRRSTAGATRMTTNKH